MSLPYYKRFPRDFLEGTIGLTFEEKGAYGIVLDLIYMRGGRLEDDARYVAGQLGCSVRMWKGLLASLVSKGKISIQNGFIVNFRAEKEIENVSKYQDKQSENRSNPNKNKGVQSPKSDHSRDYPEPDSEPDKNDVDDSASAPVDDLGWPEGMVAVVDALTDITPSDPRRAPWQADRRSLDQYLIWQEARVPWQTVTDVITDLIAKKRDGPPVTMAYFTQAILQAHADRTAPVIIPEPRQPHERRNADYKTAGQRNQDSTVRVFGAIFGSPSDGEAEPVRDAG